MKKKITNYNGRNLLAHMQNGLHALNCLFS